MVFEDGVETRPAGGAVVLAGDGLVVVLAVEGEGFDADVDADVLDAAVVAGLSAAGDGREVVLPVAGLDKRTHWTEGDMKSASLGTI